MDKIHSPNLEPLDLLATASDVASGPYHLSLLPIFKPEVPLMSWFRSNTTGGCQIALIVSIALLLDVSSVAQTPAANEVTSLAPLDVPAMTAELNRLAAVCEELQLSDEAALCRRWLPVERPDQLLLYLPVASQLEKPANRNQAAWVRHFETARQRHAEYYYQTSRAAAARGDDLTAYRMLWRTLREHPEHAEAKRVLGRLATSSTARPQLRRSSGQHPTYAWPGNSYTRVESPHFYLTSRATTPQTIELATQLEEFYALWTQFFFPLWSPPGLLQAKLEGRSGQFESQRQIKVVFLRDRADYIATLGVKEENIGVSVGYYDPQSETSYFFPDAGLKATLFHELTHQLLAEATRIDAHSPAGTQESFWLLEGIALYMESLWQGESYWTLGGFESPRLQTARYRALRDGYFVPWAEFNGGNMDGWKADADIARLYSQAAGLSHAILDADNADFDKDLRHAKLLQALVSIYQAVPDTATVLQMLGGDQIQKHYETWLTVTDAQIASFRSARPVTELVLAASELTSASWPLVTQHVELQWLDLSFANANSDDLKALGNLKHLQRLSLEGTAVAGRVLAALGQLPELKELDLTGCHITDEDLVQLARQPQLTTLWLGKTRVTDKSLTTLSSMPQLSFVEVGETGITPVAWSDFVRKNPRFRKPASGN